MAVDEAILEAVIAGQSQPTLRLYAWDPPCLSLGYSQPVQDVDKEALTQRGWHLVRRPTGGRAILHTDELTYSIMAPQTDPHVSGSILESYRRLSMALVAGLNRMGLTASADKEYDLPAGSQANGAVCFEVPANYEITVAGKKLIGSAQARRYQGVLQHGSLPLYGDLSRITHALKYTAESQRERAIQRLLAHATTVETLTGKVVSWQSAADALILAFQETLAIQLVPGELSQSEKLRASELVRDKFANPTWTDRL